MRIRIDKIELFRDQSRMIVGKDDDQQKENEESEEEEPGLGPQERETELLRSTWKL